MDFGIANAEETEYVYTEYPLERNGLALHLDCVQVPDRSPAGNILLVHGSSYSSHEFDIDYQDYSLVRRLAREGYAVWRIDIAGYGQSDPVADGFLPDTAYAAEDINTAVEEIVRVSGQDKIGRIGNNIIGEQLELRITAGIKVFDEPAFLYRIIPIDDHSVTFGMRCKIHIIVPVKVFNFSKDIPLLTFESQGVLNGYIRIPADRKRI